MLLKVADGSNNHVPKVPKSPMGGFGFIHFSLKTNFILCFELFSKRVSKIENPPGDPWGLLAHKSI